MKSLRLALISLFCLLAGGIAQAADTVNVYTIWPENYARPMFQEFEKATGIKVRAFPGSDPTKVKAMVETGNVEWDMAQLSRGSIMNLMKNGDYFERIDYSIVDKSKVTPGFAYKYGVCNYMFSTVQAWDSSKIKEKPTLADFFDFKKYPGKRLMRKDSQAMYELALMADGVPMDKLYPLDVDRAFKKLEEIKPPSKHRVHIVGLTNEMDAWMGCTDIIVSKPGGLTTSETLARGLAMVVVNPIPGQESRNSDYLLENGAAVKANHPSALSYKLEMLLKNPERLKHMQAASKAIGRPRAAYDIVEHSIKLAGIR